MAEYGKIHTDGSRSGGQPVLLPCPFCGGEAEVERSGTNRRSHIIACTDCGCRLETGETWNAGSAWNTRQPAQGYGVVTAANHTSPIGGAGVVTHGVVGVATQSNDCPKCDKFGDDCGEHSPSWKELAAYWKAEAERLRQPTQSDAVRDLVATLWCASGCSCCRDDDAWEKASHELAELLGIPKYDDGSGYDWYSVCDAALDAAGFEIREKNDG